MGNGFVFEWVFISWILTLFIHHHNIKRTSITTIKDDLVNLLTELSEFKWLDISDTPHYQQERYNAKFSRVSWKLKQLNKLASKELLDEAKLNPLYDFDIESYTDKPTSNINKLTSKKNKAALKHELQESCDQIIDELEQNHFKKIMSSKLYIFWSARHSMFGIFIGFSVVYMFIEIMSFYYS
ncbi:hypothetical protein L4D20_05480 [Vibrio kyushuensis]|uniref:hypothetical protein n=1 Tax=Vibrio kyushuensis TaxID=2910249 RepID=UPI003D1501D4